MRLQTGSPAIDKGLSTLPTPLTGLFTSSNDDKDGVLLASTRDQRGSVRPSDNLSIPNSAGGDGADIGAFEVQVAQVFYEADVSTRPNGDGLITLDDVAQIRRFLNGTDTANQATTEYQRADSSPRATFGSGLIRLDDVVQARRYQNGIDARQVAAGPMGPVLRPVAAEPTEIGNLTSAAKSNFVDLTGQRLFGEAVNGGNRRLLGEVLNLRGGNSITAQNASGSAGQTVTVNIRVDAQGSEAEYAFALTYDQTKLSNPVIGAGSAGASVRSCNTGVNGRVSCSVGGFPINNPVSSDPNIGEIAGVANQILMTVQFTVAANAQPGTTTPLLLSEADASTDDPASVSVSSINGTVTITGPTAAPVTISGRVMTFSGRGIANARVAATDQNGVVRTVRTNSFGYYRFNDIASGQTYVFNVSHKSYQFTPRVVSVFESQGKFNFVADN